MHQRKIIIIFIILIEHYRQPLLCGFNRIQSARRGFSRHQFSLLVQRASAVLFMSSFCAHDVQCAMCNNSSSLTYSLFYRSPHMHTCTCSSPSCRKCSLDSRHVGAGEHGHKHMRLERYTKRMQACWNELQRAHYVSDIEHTNAVQI
jgi:hypothetical protein